jgi:hypothetical protein
LSSCLNCGAEVVGKFCHECGQKINIHRFNTKTLLEETLHFLTHIEENFIFTTKEFIVRPGISSINYLRGKRKKYQPPISFFIIWTGAYILIHNLIIRFFHYQLGQSSVLFKSHNEEANELLRSHFTLFFMPVLFVSSIVIYFVLAKPRFTYIEVIVICLFGAGCFNALLIINDLLLGVLFQINLNNAWVFIFLSVIAGTYNLWFCYTLFKKIELRLLWLRLCITALLISFLGWIIIIYLPPLWLQLSN